MLFIRSSSGVKVTFVLSFVLHPFGLPPLFFLSTCNPGSNAFFGTFLVFCGGGSWTGNFAIACRVTFSLITCSILMGNECRLFVLTNESVKKASPGIDWSLRLEKNLSTPYVCLPALPITTSSPASKGYAVNNELQHNVSSNIVNKPAFITLPLLGLMILLSASVYTHAHASTNRAAIANPEIGCHLPYHQFGQGKWSVLYLHGQKTCC